MAHMQQNRFIGFVKEVLPEYFSGMRCLEVGSLDINGSARTFFDECDYIGIDVALGRGVDQACKGENFPGEANSFDVVISCECMEHNPGYEKTWLNMIRLLKDDGLMVMTCATLGRRQHGTRKSDPRSSPLTLQMGQDYYKNLAADDFRFVSLDRFFSRHAFFTDCSHADLLFFGLGRSASLDAQQRFDERLQGLIDFYQKIAVDGEF